MQVITLKNSTSEVFTLTKYPDGQHMIRLDFNKIDPKQLAKIKCRITTFAELEILFLLAAALAKQDIVVKEIEFVYLFGLRSDRTFNAGEACYRDVLCPIINLLPGTKILYFPHSRTWNHSQDIGFDQEHLWEVKDFLPWEESVVIAGDQSAQSIFRVPHAFTKTRKVSSIHVTINYQLFLKDVTKPFLIVDDLCDAGGTFIAEAEWLRDNYPDHKRNLFVVHGLFTQGVHHLLEYYDTIYCTNSYQDIDHPRVKQLKVI